MIRIDVEGTHARLEALARGVDLPVSDIVRTLSHASAETLRRACLAPVFMRASTLFSATVCGESGV